MSDHEARVEALLGEILAEVRAFNERAERNLTVSNERQAQADQLLQQVMASMTDKMKGGL